MVIAISTIVTDSALGGFVCFLIFCLPASIVLLIFGLIFRGNGDAKIELALWV